MECGRLTERGGEIPFLQLWGSYPCWVKLFSDMVVWGSPTSKPNKLIGPSDWTWSVVGALFWVSRCFFTSPGERHITLTDSGFSNSDI